MIRNIRILVSMLLAFHFNVGGAMRAKGEAEECGYDQNLETCNPFDLMYHGALAIKTGLALMIFTILLIIVSIVNMVKFN